jgi:hypothetical protein
MLRRGGWFWLAPASGQTATDQRQEPGMPLRPWPVPRRRPAASRYAERYRHPGHSRFGGSLQRCAASASRADRAGCCRTERRGAPLGHLCACNTTVGSAVAGGGNGRCADTRGQTRYAHHASDRARRRSDWRGRWGCRTGDHDGRARNCAGDWGHRSRPGDWGHRSRRGHWGYRSAECRHRARQHCRRSARHPHNPRQYDHDAPTTAPAPVTTTTAPATNSIEAGKLPS